MARGTHGRGRGRLVGALVVVCIAGVAAGDAPRIAELPRGGDWTRVFDGTETHADVRDGYFRGFGHERRERTHDGFLRVRRVKVYTHVEHPETKRVVKLKERWTVTSTMMLTPALRLARETATLDFKRSIDEVLDGYEFTDEHDEFFDWDEMRVHAEAGGARLARTQLLRGKVVEEDAYDYGADDVPMESVGLVLAAAVKRGLGEFEFDLLLPGGSTHGVRATLHRTRDLRPYGRAYGLPRKFADRLQTTEEVALLEMRLASPVKYLVYPHKFYLAYERAAPENVVAFWGGEPGKHLYAFRSDAPSRAPGAPPPPAEHPVAARE